MKGLCSKCYSSGVFLGLDEETSEAICEKCKKLGIAESHEIEPQSQ